MLDSSGKVALKSNSVCSGGRDKASATLEIPATCWSFMQCNQSIVAGEEMLLKYCYETCRQ